MKPEAITEDDRRQALLELKRILMAVEIDQRPNAPIVRRLLELLGQPPEFLGLLHAAAQAPADRSLALVASDWLKEHQCEADGEAMEEGWRRKLMGLILAYGSNRHDDPPGRTLERLNAIGRFLGLPEGD